jgi:hypothetical protein
MKKADPKTFNLEVDKDAPEQVLKKDSWLWHIIELHLQEFISEQVGGAKAFIQEGQIKTQQDLEDFLEGEVDQYWASNVAASMAVCLISKNSGKYIEEHGDDAARQGTIDWGPVAHYALMEDLYENLEDEGVDVNQPEKSRFLQYEDGAD